MRKRYYARTSTVGIYDGGGGRLISMQAEKFKSNYGSNQLGVCMSANDAFGPA